MVILIMIHWRNCLVSIEPYILTAREVTNPSRWCNGYIILLILFVQITVGEYIIRLPQKFCNPLQEESSHRKPKATLANLRE